MHWKVFVENSDKQTESYIIATVFCSISILLIFSFLSLFSLASGIYEIFLDVRHNGTSGDPKLMSGQISSALVLPLQTIFLVLLGWLSAIGVLLFSKFRPRMFYWFWFASSIVLILNIPFGSLFGIVLLIVLFIKRKEFRNGL
jgi:hypothetical protein